MEIKSVGQDVTVTVVDQRVCVDVTNAGPQGVRGSQVLSGSTDPSPTIGLIGDQYINTSTGYLFGPKTTSGWGTGVSLTTNPAELGQVYSQTTPSTVWNIAHTLSFIPNIIIVDSEQNVVEGEYEYVDQNLIIATFSAPIAGSAYLS